MTLEKRKQWLVDDLFVGTADEDYLLARWCYFNDMHRQFFWHAAQAIEKYQKASLVLNGHSISEFSHELLKPYILITNYANEFLRNFYCPEQNLIFKENPELWVKETHEEFIGKIEKHGVPSNRYDYFGIFLDYGDLFKLDQLVFQLRNLCVNLNEIYDEDTDNAYFNYSYAQILREKPNSQLFKFNDKLISEKRFSKSLYELARDNNYLFAKNYEHTFINIKIRSTVSRLEMLYAGNFSYAAETKKWFENNFKDLSKKDKIRLAEIENKMIKLEIE